MIILSDLIGNELVIQKLHSLKHETEWSCRVERASFHVHLYLRNILNCFSDILLCKIFHVYLDIFKLTGAGSVVQNIGIVPYRYCRPSTRSEKSEAVTDTPGYVNLKEEYRIILDVNR